MECVVVSVEKVNSEHMKSSLLLTLESFLQSEYSSSPEYTCGFDAGEDKEEEDKEEKEEAERKAHPFSTEPPALVFDVFDGMTGEDEVGDNKEEYSLIAVSLTRRMADGLVDCALWSIV